MFGIPAGSVSDIRTVDAHKQYYRGFQIWLAAILCPWVVSTHHFTSFPESQTAGQMNWNWAIRGCWCVDDRGQPWEAECACQGRGCSQICKQLRGSGPTGDKCTHGSQGRASSDHMSAWTAGGRDLLTPPAGAQLSGKGGAKCHGHRQCQPNRWKPGQRRAWKLWSTVGSCPGICSHIPGPKWNASNYFSVLKNLPSTCHK